MKITKLSIYNNLSILPMSLGYKRNGEYNRGNLISASLLEICPNCKNEVEWFTTGMIAFKLKCDKCSTEFRPYMNK